MPSPSLMVTFWLEGAARSGTVLSGPTQVTVEPVGIASSGPGGETKHPAAAAPEKSATEAQAHASIRAAHAEVSACSGLRAMRTYPWNTPIGATSTVRVLQLILEASP